MENNEDRLTFSPAPIDVPIEIQDYVERLKEELETFFSDAIVIRRVVGEPDKAYEGMVVWNQSAYGAAPFNTVGLKEFRSGMWHQV